MRERHCLSKVKSGTLLYHISTPANICPEPTDAAQVSIPGAELRRQATRRVSGRIGAREKCTDCTSTQICEFNLAEESQCVSRHSYWFLMPWSSQCQTTCLREGTASHNEPPSVDGNHILPWNVKSYLAGSFTDKKSLSLPADVWRRQIHICDIFRHGILLESHFESIFV